ncbi:MAG: hypothetical protein OIN83_07870 [Candidatus Methanoperedens sp.]|nr:hypothetical protein [Candidatus Methanoperedens sp.]
MQEKMMGFMCKKCGKVMYPKHERCLGCKNTEFDEVSLGDECHLITFTKLYALPRGIEMSPLTLGIVEFNNKVRAMGQIMADDPEPGMDLHPVWAKLRTIDEKEVYGFKFDSIV